MAEGLPEDVQSVRRTFDMFVHQNTEEINCLDFANAVRSLGYNPTNNQVDEVLKTAEKGEKDKLGFDEFVELLKNFDGCKKEDAEDSLREAFKKFDRDGNGFISPDELLYVVCNSGEKLSREEAEELISMFDTNSDGQLSWEEFVEFFKCDREAPEASMSIVEEETPEDDCAVGTSLIS